MWNNSMTRLCAICKTSSPMQIYSVHLKVCSTCPKEPNDFFPLETERFVIIWPLLLTLQVRCSSDWARTRMQTSISVSHSDCHSFSSNSNFIHGTTRVRVRASFLFLVFFFLFSLLVCKGQWRIVFLPWHAGRWESTRKPPFPLNTLADFWLVLKQGCWIIIKSQDTSGGEKEDGGGVSLSFSLFCAISGS